MPRHRPPRRPSRRRRRQRDPRLVELEDLVKRQQAEFANYRRRTQAEAKEARLQGAAELATQLLPAFDALTLALQEVAEGPLRDGLELVYSKLETAFAAAGLEVFSPLNELFDPRFHEAVAQREQEGVPRGTIVDVYQPGCLAGERVVRPARVVVAA